MEFSKKTVKDIDLKDKTVLVRVDFNVLNDQGEITETYRLEQTVPTIKYLQAQNARIVLISHAGRPEGKVIPTLSLEPVAKKLSEILGQAVKFVADTVGAKAEEAVSSMQPGEVVLLENLRFYPEEEANDPEFAKQLASLAEVFVEDGFGVVHRAHASTDAITKFLPSVAGLLLEKEVSTIADAVDKPARPFVAIAGGAKVSDKIEFLRAIAAKADKVLAGGAMGNTFLKEQNANIGKSVYEEGQRAAVESFASYKDKIVLPQQVAVGPSLDPDAVREDKPLAQVKADDYILDNDFSAQFRDLAQAKTIIWNGPIGMTEFDNFKKGSLELADAIINSSATSIVGGGDTAAFIARSGLLDKFSHVSTGGGAALELMAGKTLPGVEALLDK